MPLDLSGSIGSISNLIAQKYNTESERANNIGQAQFSLGMYKLQRKDALKDYATNNEYNSPRAQMQRFRDAGLNENLIYGNSTQAAPIRSTDSKGASFTAPKIDSQSMGNSLTSMYDTRLKSAETDNLAKQGTILQQTAINQALEADKIKAETLNINSNTAGSTLDQTLKSKLAPYNLQAADLNNQKLSNEIPKLQADTQYTNDQNIRAAAQNSASLRETAERILRSQADRSKTPYEKREIEARIQALGSDNILKQLDIELKKQGIQPHDGIIQRTVMQKIQELTSVEHFNRVKETLKKAGDYINEKSRILPFKINRY